MEIIRLAPCTRLLTSRSLLVCTRGCRSRRGASIARSFSVYQPCRDKQDFPSTDELSPVLDSAATDPSLVNELATRGGELASLELGGLSPIGLLQNMLEMVHVNLGLPWWGSIALCTVAMRIVILPLVVNLQKNTIRMNNIRPEMEKIMDKVRAHNRSGNDAMVAFETSNLLALHKAHNCSPAKLFLAPVIQAPIFISFFLAIREMANAPVESMKMGGMFWFMDLTVTDPFYLLPVLNAALFMTSLELGGDIGVRTPQMEKMKMVLRAFGIATGIATAYFPTGLFMYWMTSSMFSLGQILVLRQPGLRKRLGFPDVVHHPLPGTGDLFSKPHSTASKSH